MIEGKGSVIDVLGMHVVGCWRWGAVPSDLHCVICENPFELPCASCEIPGDSCPPAFGLCGHVFHLHCIGACQPHGGLSIKVPSLRREIFITLSPLPPSGCRVFSGAWLHRDGVRSEEQATCPMCRQHWRYASQQAEATNPEALEIDDTSRENANFDPCGSLRSTSATHLFPAPVEDRDHRHRGASKAMSDEGEIIQFIAQFR